MLSNLALPGDKILDSSVAHLQLYLVNHTTFQNEVKTVYLYMNIILSAINQNVFCIRQSCAELRATNTIEDYKGLTNDIKCLTNKPVCRTNINKSKIHDLVHNKQT